VDKERQQMKEIVNKMPKEELLVELKRINPEMYRTWVALEKARKDNEGKVPDAFRYIRALQEFDKENGIKTDKGQYIYMFKHYDEVVKPYFKELP
jgi:hypothetical protein